MKTMLSTVIHLCATVSREADIMCFAEIQKCVALLRLEAVRTDNDFPKAVFFMDLRKIFQSAEHTKTIAIAVAVAFVAGDETDDVFPSCAADVDHD